MRTLWHPTRKSVSAAMAGKLDGATGSALITLERVKGRVCFRLNWSGIGTPVAAYIQQGAGGSAVVPLFVDAPKRRGCVKAPKALIRQIAECPSSYYVTVHTHSRPGGALLGRL